MGQDGLAVTQRVAVHVTLTGRCARAARSRCPAARKRAVTCFGYRRIFFLISSGSPHVRPMGRTCGRGARRNRIDPHGGEIERPTPRTAANVPVAPAPDARPRLTMSLTTPQHWPRRLMIHLRHFFFHDSRQETIVIMLTGFRPRRAGRASQQLGGQASASACAHACYDPSHVPPALVKGPDQNATTNTPSQAK